MQLVTLFRFVEVLIDAPGGATLTFYTDLPGNAMASRSSVGIPATSGRHSFRLPLSGSVKGKLYQLKIVPNGGTIVSVYAAKVYARVLGPAAAPWQWYAVPVTETPVEWSAVKLPIPATSEDWQPVKLPIPATSDDWSALKLPIDPTSEQWAEMKLPVKETPVVPEWVQVGVDA